MQLLGPGLEEDLMRYDSKFLSQEKQDMEGRNEANSDVYQSHALLQLFVSHHWACLSTSSETLVFLGRSAAVNPTIARLPSDIRIARDPDKP